jgi:hypothetical protein
MLMCVFFPLKSIFTSVKMKLYHLHVFVYFGWKLNNTPCYFLSARLNWHNLHTRLRIGSSKPNFTDKTRILACANIVGSLATCIFTPQKTILLTIFILSRVGASNCKCDQVFRKYITVLWLCESEDTENHWFRQQLQNNLAVLNGWHL